MSLGVEDLQGQLDRRRPGTQELVSSRSEQDRVSILSGVEAGVTLGSPVLLYVENADKRPSDYGRLKNVPRPSHADFTYLRKYGVTAASGPYSGG